mgnify:CR=1 FL=1
MSPLTHPSGVVLHFLLQNGCTNSLNSLSAVEVEDIASRCGDNVTRHKNKPSFRRLNSLILRLVFFFIISTKGWTKKKIDGWHKWAMDPQKKLKYYSLLFCQATYYWTLPLLLLYTNTLYYFFYGFSMYLKFWQYHLKCQKIQMSNLPRVYLAGF